MVSIHRSLLLLSALALAMPAGCARRAAVPSLPAPDGGTREAAAVADSPAAAIAPAVAPGGPGVPSAERPSTPPDTPAARQRAQPAPEAAPPSDSLADGDDAFLDTLRTIFTDSLTRPRGELPPELVRLEASELFGPPPAASRSAATWDIDVATYAGHDRVQYYIEYFTGPARRHFQAYLSRLGRYDSMIRGRLRDAGLPQDLIYLAMIESGLNPNAVSRARAVGMWQFISATARRYGLYVDPWLDERRDPFLATDAAIRFLRELNGRFGSLFLAAAAYNGGPGTISRGLNRYDFGALDGDDAFFALAEEQFLRRETRDYVPKLIAAALVAKQPERYGFTNIVPLSPLRYDSVTVPYAVGLDVLARLADTSQLAMEDLNPQLVRRVTPPNRAVLVRVPVGRADSVAARLAALPPRERVTFLTHSIRRGETLGHISVLYHVSVEDILSANRGLRPRALRVGRELVIPTSGVPAAVRAAWREATRTIPSARSGAGSAARSLSGSAGRRGSGSAARPGTGTAPAPTRRSVHIVRRGETLSGIAEQFHVPLSRLLSANRLTSRSRIHPGDAIRIPT